MRAGNHLHRNIAALGGIVRPIDDGAAAVTDRLDELVGADVSATGYCHAQELEILWTVLTPVPAVNLLPI
jgi:hypothetical protein